MRNLTETVKHLLIINGIFFLATITLGDITYDWFALHYPGNPKFQLWQPFTHMFMHGDLSHIFFNMFGLYMFGVPLERMWGKQKFIFFYISTGLGAAALQLVLYALQMGMIEDQLISLGASSTEILKFFQTGYYNPMWAQTIGDEFLAGGYRAYQSVMVGASGALYGVLVAFAWLFPNSQLMLLFPPIPIRAKYFVPLLILSDLFFGFTSYSIGPIAHFAHVGGALAGLLMMWYWKRSQFNQNRWD
ncbi:MAG: rhomboid family intramembrane serine protease [Flavobacteriaceae bacterium]